MYLSNEQLSDYERDGFVRLRGVIDSDVLGAWERDVVATYSMQALKIPEIRDGWSFDLDITKLDVNALSVAVLALEDASKEVAYQARKMTTMTVGAHGIAADKVICEICKDLLGGDQSLPFFDGPNLYYNIPEANRLAYKWHSEGHCYPRRRNVLNLWFPMYGPKYDGNGTMYVRSGSHKANDLDYTFYRGYDASTLGKANYWTQYEIAESSVSQYNQIAIEAEPGDLVVFHKNLVHSSSINKESSPTFHAGVRVWDARKDLTLTADLAASTPGNDLGYPGLTPL